LLELRLLPEQGDILAWLHAHGQIVSRADSEDSIQLKVMLSSADIGRFKSKFGAIAS